ncbi:hypothetical protein ACHAPJ_012980 [Fusarium lateritium]
MSNNIKYAHIDDASSDYEGEHQRPARKRRQWISLLSSFLVGLATMGVVMALYSTLMMPKPPHARNLPHSHNGSDPETGLPLSWSHGDCGNSPEDAKERDCRYSVVLHAWLPQSCLTESDAEDAEDLYKDRNWHYTAASGHNLTMEELGAGDYVYFVTAFDWHVTHCMYVWKRLHRIMLDPTQELDSYTANYHHTNHCVKMIGGDAGGMKDSGTKVFVKYPKCAK